MSKLKIWSFACGFAITQKKSEIVFNTICHFNNNCCYYLNVYSIYLQTYGGFCKRKSNVNEIFLPTLRTKFNLNTAWDAFFVNPQFLFPNNINKITNSFLFLPYSKIVELEEELRVVGNNLKSLEVSEEKVSIESCEHKSDYLCIYLSKYIYLNTYIFLNL